MANYQDLAHSPPSPFEEGLGCSDSQPCFSHLGVPDQRTDSFMTRVIYPGKRCSAQTGWKLVATVLFQVIRLLEALHLRGCSEKGWDYGYGYHRIHQMESGLHDSEPPRKSVWALQPRRAPVVQEPVRVRNEPLF